MTFVEDDQDHRLLGVVVVVVVVASDDDDDAVGADSHSTLDGCMRFDTGILGNSVVMA